MKKCTKCEQERELTDFYISNKKKGTRKIICRFCCQAKVKEDRKSKPDYWKNAENNRKKKWGKQYPDRLRKSRLMYEYGITIEQYEELLVKQGKVCAICGLQEVKLSKETGIPKRLAVDHCHKTGKVRGLLCFHCNSVLGKMKDSIELLESAIDYLKKSIDKKEEV